MAIREPIGFRAVELLLEYGADVARVFDKAVADFPIKLAARLGNEEVVVLIPERGPTRTGFQLGPGRSSRETALTGRQSKPPRKSTATK